MAARSGADSAGTELESSDTVTHAVCCGQRNGELLHRSLRCDILTKVVADGERADDGDNSRATA